MNEANKQALLSALRSLLMVGGASLGMFSTETLNEIIGAVMVIVPIVWGIWDKYQSEAKTKAREAVAVNVGIAVADRTAGITPPVSAALAPAVIEAFAPVVPEATEPPLPNPTGLSVSPSSPVLPTATRKAKR